MRRMNGRTPPFVSVGLVFIILLLAYNYWTLSSQNDDLKKEIDKLQTEVKISGVKQSQFEKKNQILQNNVHDLDEKSEKLQLQIEEENQHLSETKNELKKEEYEITKLKNSLIKKEEAERNLLQQLEERDNKIEEAISNTQHILSLKNDAEEALAEKDLQINGYKMELEQAKSVATEYEAQLKNLKDESSKLKLALASLQKERAAGRPPPSPGAFNIPNAEKKEKETLNQIQEPSSHDKIQEQLKNGAFYNANHIDQENNVIPNPPIAEANDDKKLNHHLELLKKPILSPLSSSPSNKGHLMAPVELQPVHQEEHDPVLHEPDHEHSNGLENQEHQRFIDPETNVLAQPPQNPVENPDTAIDDEEKAIEDPSDDQDEEGKEIKKDLENNAVENYDNGDYDEEKVDNPHLNKDDNNVDSQHEPRGIGAIEIPRHDVKGIKENHDDVNLDDDVDHRANERLYETNFDNKIRNLARL